MHHSDNATRPDPDQLLCDIADYVLNVQSFGELAMDTARYCLMDSIGCGLLALTFPDCVKHLGPVVAGATMKNGVRVPGTSVPGGVRVPGTAHQLDPIKAAFDIGCIVRWLDFNDTWLAAEWGHPSDNLGAILSIADYLCRSGQQPVTMYDVLVAMIQAHEIQGVLALKNSFNRVGLDHVVLVKVASTAVATRMLGGSRDQIISALSHAWVDGQSLRTYRHAPNAGPRKSWAAGDATSRAVRLALIAMKGETSIPTALSASKWGFQDVAFKNNPITLDRPLGSYVMENILFKIAFPAEFHAQTAVEAAFQLHPLVRNRLDDIKTIHVQTHESAIRIIDKRGPMNNPADRDHCLQYMIAIGLLFGELKAEHYENAFHIAHAEIDALREKMIVSEEKQYSFDYLDPDKRSIANALTVEFADGSKTARVAVEYPLGHRRRRAEGIPLLVKKLAENLRKVFDDSHAKSIEAMCADASGLTGRRAEEFMSAFVK